MTREQAEAFAKVFTQSFGEPFLPKGFARCSTFNHGDKTSLVFDIGDRNVAFDAELMQWYGQGTKVDPDWLIEQTKQAAA